ncbi:unnamed protein product [Camellia sinensis]
MEGGLYQCCLSLNRIICSESVVDWVFPCKGRVRSRRENMQIRIWREVVGVILDILEVGFAGVFGWYIVWKFRFGVMVRGSCSAGR